MIKKIGKVAGFVAAICTVISFFQYDEEEKNGTN